jgi:hypothetical protein
MVQMSKVRSQATSPSHIAGKNEGFSPSHLMTHALNHHSCCPLGGDRGHCGSSQGGQHEDKSWASWQQ